MDREIGTGFPEDWQRIFLREMDDFYHVRQMPSIESDENMIKYSITVQLSVWYRQRRFIVSFQVIGYFDYEIAQANAHRLLDRDTLQTVIEVLERTFLPDESFDGLITRLQVLISRENNQQGQAEYGVRHCLTRSCLAEMPSSSEPAGKLVQLRDRLTQLFEVRARAIVTSEPVGESAMQVSSAPSTTVCSLISISFRIHKCVFASFATFDEEVSNFCRTPFWAEKVTSSHSIE